MAKFYIGDLVVLKSGSMRMCVEDATEEQITTVWCNEGVIGRDTFNPALLNKWEDRGDRSFQGGRGNFGDRDRGGSRGGFNGGGDRGGDRDRGGRDFGDRDRGGYDDRPPRKHGWDGKPRDKKHFRKDD
ncbi:MAG: hypothetical protein AAGI34_10075 [Pseudomonadota bacterium]